MLTLQRSPPVVCSDVFEQVNLDKDPTLADLRARDFSGAGFLLQRDGVDIEQTGRRLQGERIQIGVCSLLV